MNFEHVLPVLTLLLGWFLNSLSPIFQDRRDNRKALGNAIADLLEIRHDLFARQTTMGIIKTIGPLTPDEERIVWRITSKSLPQNNEDLSKRYDAAVTLIAATDPLLGFQLRSKDYVSKIGPILSQIEAQFGQSLAVFSEMEAQVYSAAIPHINEVIVDLSRRHGYYSGFKIRRFIKKEMTPPKEAEDILTSLKSALEKARAAEISPAQQLPTKEIAK